MKYDWLKIMTDNEINPYDWLDLNYILLEKLMVSIMTST